MGDSFTEGVGDRSKRLPNGVRGWADRVAEKLAKAEPGWEYANLAIRSKRLRHIIDEQLEPALAMEPTLVTLYAGGNDILDFGTDVDALMADYETLVARLAATGATVVLFTGFDVKVSAVLEPLKKRNTAYNRRVREIAAKYNAVLVDYWCFDAFHDRRMWDSDRLHMSKAGHKYLAAQVLDHLGVPHKISPLEWEPPVEAEPAGVGTAAAALGARLGVAALWPQAARRHPRGQAQPALAGTGESAAEGRAEETPGEGAGSCARRRASYRAGFRSPEPPCRRGIPRRRTPPPRSCRRGP